MASIEQYRGPAVGRGATRQVGRTLSRIEANTSTQIARVESRADIQSAKIDAATAISQRALQSVAYLGAVEMQLAESCPSALARLGQVGSTASLAVQQILMDSVVDLRRL
jgi:hypothetical protein